METSRINIAYRPLRLAWAIHSSDRDAMRRVARMSYALWGGRYNPIVFADKPEQAKALIEVFRADLIISVGDSPEVSNIRQRFPYLITPFIPEELYIDRQHARPLSQVLDIHNLLVHWNEKPEWRLIKDQGFRCISWEEDDPLADALLLSYGAYPPVSETGVDYNAILFDATMGIELSLNKARPIDPQIMNHPNVGYLARHGLRRHYSVRVGGWNLPGFFIGDANNIEELVTFWNLRAADISLYFIDLNHPERYRAILPILTAHLQQRLASLPEYRQHLAIWTSSDDKIAPAKRLLGEGQWSHCRIGDSLWNGLNAVPPMMMLGETSSLGVIGTSGGKPSVSFTLNDKPFSGDNYFFTQRLVASIQVYGGDDEATTFHPPYVPELNETLARSMHGIYNELRSEPERLGVVIDAADHDLRLNALPVSELIQESFRLAGLKARPSSSGLIARQLVSRLGGVDGARVFKIPGVRRLLKTYGPNASFTRNAAIRQIGCTPNFNDHERLYIEPRPHGTKRSLSMVYNRPINAKCAGTTTTRPAKLLAGSFDIDAQELTGPH